MSLQERIIPESLPGILNPERDKKKLGQKLDNTVLRLLHLTMVYHQKHWIIPDLHKIYVVDIYDFFKFPSCLYVYMLVSHVLPFLVEIVFLWLRKEMFLN